MRCLLLSTQEAHSPAQLTERQRPPSICRNGPVRARDHLASGADCQLLHFSYAPPLSLVLSTSTVTVCCMLQAPWGPELQSKMQALPISWLCAHFPGSHLLSTMCLSIIEAGSCTLRVPAFVPPLSLFRIQTAAMVELLAILMDPFICH